MLIEFKVKNYRSIRDEQGISMIAGNDDTLPENTFQATRKADNGKSAKMRENVAFLKSAVVYGANASGKSTLLAAMRDLFSILARSGPYPIFDTLTAEPFLLDRKSKKAPIEFFVSFTSGFDDVQYDFTLAVRDGTVVEERLDYYPRGRSNCLYHRTGQAIRLPGNELKNGKFYMEHTGPDKLFWSVAASLEQPILADLQKLFDSTEILPMQWQNPWLMYDRFAESLVKRSDAIDGLRKWVKHADLGISDYTVVEDEQIGHLFKSVAQNQVAFKPMKVFQFLHANATGKTSPVDFASESDGTKRWLELFFLVDSVLRKGSVLIVDEISDKLHPLLTEEVFKIFHDKKLNPHNAQLVCSTHYATLLGSKMLRRDQIWFAEKDKSGASRYYSLWDYRPRKGEALMKGYLAGHYGAVPELPDLDALAGRAGEK